MYVEVGVGVGFSLSVWSVFVIAWSIYFTFYVLSYLFAYSRSGSAHCDWVSIIQATIPEIKSVHVTTRATIKFYARRKRCARYLNVFHAFERSRQDARISNLLTLLGSIKTWSVCYHERIVFSPCMSRIERGLKRSHVVCKDVLPSWLLFARLIPLSKGRKHRIFQGYTWMTGHKSSLRWWPHTYTYIPSITGS